ncbi:hypothetical protein MY494_05455 [Synechococcus sp. A10-1-5-1]|uniref:hypothetical protein n=1 Tax=Synechococcus sp. A10-1-5-1 TaxID=2936507 RepID=UPI0020015B98|nr:hypothetical protein [Synechococcus sp. A10-1-5-1]UPM51205.1 hypothetical protein MY494_05455 [Synechococcus sp. A10-1-5-1]
MDEQLARIASQLNDAAAFVTPEVIRAGRKSAAGAEALVAIEYAINTMGKALVLTDLSIDPEQDAEVLRKFRQG